MEGSEKTLYGPTKVLTLSAVWWTVWQTSLTHPLKGIINFSNNVTIERTIRVPRLWNVSPQRTLLKYYQKMVVSAFSAKILCLKLLMILSRDSLNKYELYRLKHSIHLWYWQVLSKPVSYTNLPLPLQSFSLSLSSFRVPTFLYVFVKSSFFYRGLRDVLISSWPPFP